MYIVYCLYMFFAQVCGRLCWRCVFLRLVNMLRAFVGFSTSHPCASVMFNDYDFHVSAGHVKVAVSFSSVGLTNTSVGSMWHSFVCFSILILVLSHVVGNLKHSEMLALHVYAFSLCAVGIVRSH